MRAKLRIGKIFIVAVRLEFGGCCRDWWDVVDVVDVKDEKGSESRSESSYVFGGERKLELTFWFFNLHMLTGDGCGIFPSYWSCARVDVEMMTNTFGYMQYGRA